MVISGDLGSMVMQKRRVGRPINKEETILKYGVISLYHDDNMIASNIFGSKSRRKEIIDDWYKIYRLTEKTNVYFHIKYTEP